jgi:hypothetical protein
VKPRGLQHRAVLLLALSAVAAAADPVGEKVTSSVKRALAPCAAITDRDKRLECFDSLAAGVAAPVTSTPVTEPSAPVANAARAANAAPAASEAPGSGPEDFGLTAAQQERAKPRAQPDSIADVVSSVWHSNSGRMLVELDNGQSWELDRPDPLLAAGDKIKIERAAMGSFLLTTPTRRSYHARRLH